jgi:ADP-heptose:LPS heptosyltransferase
MPGESTIGRTGTAEHILLVRLKSIGDIVFTLPAVNIVRENFPQAHISYLISREHTPLLSGFRAIDEIIPLDRARYRSANPVTIMGEAFRLVQLLRRRKYRLAVDFQGYGETALLAWLTGAPQRWGARRSGARTVAYTRHLQRTGRRHPIERHVALLQQNGLKTGLIQNDFVLPETAMDDARRFCAEHHLDPAQPMLFIQPYTSRVKKDWGLDNYLALARHYRSQSFQVMFGGGPGENAALEPAAKEGFVVSAGVPLLTSAGLAKLCTLVIGGDTGLLHLAVAMGKPVRMLMNSAQPGRAYPFQHPEWAITPADRRTVASIPLHEVTDACDQVLLPVHATR